MEYYSPPATQPTEPYVAPPLEPERKSLRNRFGGAIAALAVLLGKFKSVLLLLPKLKVLSTSGTMLVSVAAYALIWGWTFAVGFVLLLFVHEMGHVVQLRREGIKASAPLFIPFMGAFVGMKQMPQNAAAEARVGLAGPILGSLACLVPFVIWKSTGNTFWEAPSPNYFILRNVEDGPVDHRNRLVQRALKYPDLWTLYLDTLEECANSAAAGATTGANPQPGWLESEIQREYLQIRDAALADTLIFTNAQFEQAIADVKAFAAGRSAAVKAQVATYRARGPLP